MPVSSRTRPVYRSRYVIAALLFLARLILLLATIGLAIYALIRNDQQVLIYAGWCLGAFTLVAITFLVKSNQATCRLCRAQFLRNLRCSKKKGTPRILGNYNLPVALAILGNKRRIRCPYCGESPAYHNKK